MLCGGEPVPLTGKAFDLLVVLVRRSGHLVTKDELLEEVWPGIFVQETNLTVNISALRKVLARGDNGNGIIQTVPGRGYRLVAPVVARESAPASILGVESADNDFGAPNSQPVAPVGVARHLGEVTHRGWAILAAAVVCVAGDRAVARAARKHQCPARLGGRAAFRQ